MLWFRFLLGILLLEKTHAAHPGDFGSDGKLGIAVMDRGCGESDLSLPTNNDIFGNPEPKVPWSIKEGSTKRLCCGAMMKEPLDNTTAVITWYYYENKHSFGSDRPPMISTDKHNITSRQDESGHIYSYLQISNVSLQDGGLYMCLVNADTRVIDPKQPTLHLAKFLDPFVITVFSNGLQFENKKYKKTQPMELNTQIVTLLYKLKPRDPDCHLQIRVETDETLFQYINVISEQILIVNPIPHATVLPLKDVNFKIFTSCKGDSNSEISRSWVINGWINGKMYRKNVILPSSVNQQDVREIDTPYLFYVVGDCDKFDWTLKIDSSNGETVKLPFKQFDKENIIGYEDDIEVSYRFIPIGSTDELKKKNLLIELKFRRKRRVYLDITGIRVYTKCNNDEVEHEDFQILGLPEFDDTEGPPKNCVPKDVPINGPDVIQQFPCCKVYREIYVTNLWVNGKYQSDKDMAIGRRDQNTDWNKWYEKYVGFYQCFVSGYLNKVQSSPQPIDDLPSDHEVNEKHIVEKFFTMNFNPDRLITMEPSNDQVGHIIVNNSMEDTSMYISKIGEENHVNAKMYTYTALSSTCMRIKISGKAYPVARFSFKGASKLFISEDCKGTSTKTPMELYTHPAYDMVQTTTQFYTLVKDSPSVIDVTFKVTKTTQPQSSNLKLKIYPIKAFIKQPSLTKSGSASGAITISCRVEGFPVTDVKLYKTTDPMKGRGKKIFSDVIDTTNGTEITKELLVSLNGDYMCSAYNPKLKRAVNSTLEISGMPEPTESSLIIAGVVGVVMFAIILMWVGCVTYRKYRYPNAKFKEVVCCVSDPYSPIDKVPLQESRFRVHYDTLNPGRTLGGGHFGIVYEGWSTHLPDRKGDRTTIAIKEVRPGCGDLFKREEDLRVEKDIMIRVIGHRNVLALYGYTDEPDKVALVLEFAQFGSLDKLLANARKCKTDGYMITDEHVDDAIASFEPHHIIDFGKQIAEGMEFIGDKQIVHRDLAARNVVVAGDRTEYILKITDFGLARDVADCDGIYERKVGKEIPIKWTAPESLNDTYTSKSDVWSYGITLWELCTLGGDPYHGLANAEIRDRLASGYRLQKPQSCNDEIYQLMMDCWQQNPDNRPAFKDLVSLFHTFSKKPDVYVQTGDLYEEELNLTLKLNHSNNVDPASGTFLRQSSHASSAEIPAANEYTPSPGAVAPENITIDPDSELNVNRNSMPRRAGSMSSADVVVADSDVDDDDQNLLIS